MKTKYSPASLAFVCLVNLSAFAQTNDPASFTDDTHNVDWTASAENVWKYSDYVDYSAVAAGHVNYNGVNGTSGAQSGNANFMLDIPLAAKWFLPLGVTWHDLSLGTVSGAPIPHCIDTLGVNAGLGYHLDDQWTIAGGVGPRFYRLDDQGSGDIGVAGMVRATYLYKPNLTFAFGLAVNPDRDVPVLPAAGVRWAINPELTLSLMFPQSGLDYRLNSRLNLFAGLDGNFTVFRGENDLGNKIGMSQFNNGLGTYRDFHAGVGAEYRIWHDLSAIVEGGYSFAREIDYQRIDQTVKFDSAPYFTVGLKSRF